VVGYSSNMAAMLPQLRRLRHQPPPGDYRRALVGQDRFPRRPVKNDGCHDPRRLPPSSGSPRTEGSRNRFRLPNHPTPFANASLPARLDPRPPPRPQPKWLLWVRCCPMISATKTESGAHPADSTTSLAPRRLAIRCGSCHQGQPAVSRACPWPKPREAPVEAPRTGRAIRDPACTQRCRGRLSNARTPHTSPHTAPSAWIANNSSTQPRHSLEAGPRERTQHRRLPGCFLPPRNPRGCNSPRVPLDPRRWNPPPADKRHAFFCPERDQP
jgi:hypothetical protein